MRAVRAAPPGGALPPPPNRQNRWMRRSDQRRDAVFANYQRDVTGRPLADLIAGARPLTRELAEGVDVGRGARDEPAHRGLVEVTERQALEEREDLGAEVRHGACAGDLHDVRLKEREHLRPDDEERGKNLIQLVNPVLAEAEGETVWEEGCLSVVDFRAEVDRAEKVLVKGYDIHGKELAIEADGLLAVALQHEIDHLDGTLFIDHLSRLKREMYVKRVKKAIRDGRPLTASRSEDESI